MGKNKDFIQAFNEDFWNKQNLAAFEKYFTADFISHYPEGDLNSEQVKGLCQAYFSAFPDLHITTNDLIAEGDKVTKVWTAHCTHKGDFMGIPATGKRIVVTGIEVFRIADGKIAENWVSMDNLGMMQQLGVIPPLDA
ncbi:MAG: ester cyclase [Bacteroidales bacterium]|nr:ester cyclase [Bacteroidales bacterium]